MGTAGLGAKLPGKRRRALPFIGALTAALAWFLPGAAPAANPTPTTARFPLGLYAHVDIEVVLPQLVKKVQLDEAHKGIRITQSATQACAVVTASSSDLAALHADFQTFYTDLLSNPAISGITAGVHWCRVQIDRPDSPCPIRERCLPGGNDWSYVDDIFTAVRNYNAANSANKTIQLIVTPGVYSPSWLTDGSILKSCDQLFPNNQALAGQPPLSDCGMVTFNPYPEQRKALHSKEPLVLPMPLPWSSKYLHYWRLFVEDLAANYGQDQALVAVVIAGPTAATTEMILPTSANGSFQCSPVAGNPTQCNCPPASGNSTRCVPADQAWQTLITNSFKTDRTYQQYPAQIFVDYWERAIRMYEEIFSASNLALILTPDNFENMPDVGPSLPLPQLGNERLTDFENFYGIDCRLAQSDSMSCQLKATVIFYLLNHPIPATATGTITRGTSVGGMTARSPISTGKIDVAGVKLVTSNPPWFTKNGVPFPGGPFIGGAEFDHDLTLFDLANNSYEPSSNPWQPVSINFQAEACRDQQQNCPGSVSSGGVSVAQGAFQVFTAFFSGTSAAYLFDGVANPPPLHHQSSIQYVDLEWQDVMYASATAGNCALGWAQGSTQFPGNTLLQDVFNQANYGLQVVAGNPNNISPPALICASSP